MSLAFNDTATRKGIVQIYEKRIGANRGFISDNTDRLKDFTADTSLAFDAFFTIALPASGTWQLDDSGHTAYPVITADLVASQRDYNFTVDAQSNLILDIYRVLVADSSGVFHEMDAVDVQSQSDTTGFFDGRNTTGFPIKYDKTGNGIFLDPIPNYSYTNGLKIYINREASYFVSTDTTKMPGVPGLFHEWFAIQPAMKYAEIYAPSKYEALARDVSKMERDIASYFGKRARDERVRLTVANHSNK